MNEGATSVTTHEPSTAGSNRRYVFDPEGAGYGLVVEHGPKPQPGSGEVLVRVEAASLNYRDLLMARRKTAGLVPLSDGAGTVESVGEGVVDLRPGHRVIAGFFCDWIDGPFKADYSATARGGGGTNGMLSRYVLATEAQLVGIPDQLTTVQASTLPCAGNTAWTALFARARVQPGDTVLVLGTGGVSIFGLQLATAAGARVIVTSSSDEKLERARGLGAWQTVNYQTQPDWDDEVLRLTDGLGALHILETGGQGTFERSLKAVRAGGSIAQIGGLTGFGPQLNLMRLQLINADIHGINVGSMEGLASLADYLVKNSISPVVDRVYDFDEVSAALDDLAGGRLFGKLVVRV